MNVCECASYYLCRSKPFWHPKAGAWVGSTRCSPDRDTQIPGMQGNSRESKISLKQSWYTWTDLQFICHNYITWFECRGNKQFGFKKSVFGAKFDPYNHKNHRKHFFFYLVKGIILSTYLFRDNSMKNYKTA